MSCTGDVLGGRYRLESRIGSGGTGEIWRALDTVLGWPVAVRLIRAEYAGHAGTLARIATQARRASMLAHPGIVRLYDVGEAGSAHPPYLVMELVDGPSLAGVLAGGPLEPGRVLDVVSQVADGLDAAHGAGLVHRDIRPANLLVGPGGRVKITDFSLVPGTSGYMAPERLMGGPATAASDLYALGVVAYECLAGAPPFSGTPSEVAAAHRDRPLPPLPPGVPPDVVRLVSNLTARDPAARPASAGQVARRAAQIRGAPIDGVVPQLGSRSDSPTLNLHLAPAADQPSAHRSLRKGTAWSGRAVAAAVAATAVTAGTAGWLLASTSSVPPLRQPSAAPQSRATAPGRAVAVGVVSVDGSSLVGQPVTVVRRRLRQLGLVVRVLGQPGVQPAGTVISVLPAGQVPAGSLVLVTAAAYPSSHWHGGGGD